MLHFTKLSACTVGDLLIFLPKKNVTIICCLVIWALDYKDLTFFFRVVYEPCKTGWQKPQHQTQCASMPRCLCCFGFSVCAVGCLAAYPQMTGLFLPSPPLAQSHASSLLRVQTSASTFRPSCQF